MVRLLCFHFDAGHKPSYINSILSAIAKVHRDLGHADPTDSHLVRQVRTGFSKQFALSAIVAATAADDLGRIPAGHVGALDPSVVSGLLARAGPSAAAVLDLDPVVARKAACVVLGFVFMLRPGSLLRVRTRDCQPSPPSTATRALSIGIAFEKTRVAAEPRVRVLFGDPDQSPLLRLLYRAVDLAREAGDYLLYPTDPTTARAMWPRSQAEWHSATTASLANALKSDLTVFVRALVSDSSPAVFRPAVSGSTLPPSSFSGRSLRPGGATAAYRLSYTLADIKQLANWASDESVRRYLRQATSWPDGLVADAFAVVFNRFTNAAPQRPQPTSAPA